MRRLSLVLLAASLMLALGVPGAQAQGGDEDDTFAVLVYSRTAGFRHASIVNGIVAIERMGLEHGFEVETTEDPGAFTDGNLERFAAVVFLNTTGDVLEADGQDALERYVRRGGGWVGVHSAADTEYEWAFYGQMLGGAWFKNHPIQQPGVIVVEDQQHPSTAHLPERWEIPFEEFYAFQHNPRPDVHVLFTIDESTYDQDPNTSNLPDSPTFPEGETGTMGDHPMSWCHRIDDGRVWYTALGHEGYLYEDPDYREHLLGGILTGAGQVEATCAQRTTSEPEPPEPAAAPTAGATPTEEDGATTSDGLPATGAAGWAVVGIGALGAASLARRRSA